VRDLAGTRVLVVGLGVGGFSVARALLRSGAVVRVTDSSASAEIEGRATELTSLGAEVEIGGHDLDRIEADIAVVSPGIPPTSPVVEALRARGTEVLGEVEIAFRLARCDFLAVTGTNGKTTTTSLIAAILKEAGVPSAAAGNIGYPIVDAALDVPEGTGRSRTTRRPRPGS
jgi:UDP-N-acetylmuramoylalanine--D-glutamate ligase